MVFRKILWPQQELGNSGSTWESEELLPVSHIGVSGVRHPERTVGYREHGTDLGKSVTEKQISHWCPGCHFLFNSHSLHQISFQSLKWQPPYYFPLHLLPLWSSMLCNLGCSGLICFSTICLFFQETRMSSFALRLVKCLSSHVFLLGKNIFPMEEDREGWDPSRFSVSGLGRESHMELGHLSTALEVSCFHKGINKTADADKLKHCSEAAASR